MATKVKPSRLQVSGTPQVGQVPVYVDEDTFQWGAGGGGGTGDVSGPASSTDGDIVLFDGATGKVIKDSGVGLSSKLDAAALSNNAYGGGWNGDTTHTPTKDALYDKIHTMDVEIGNKAADTSVVKLTGNQTIAGTKTFSTSPVVPAKSTDAANSDTAIATEAQVYKKQDKLTTQTAYTSKGTATKVPTITTNTLGQVTAITETDIAFPVTSINGQTGAVTISEGNTKTFYASTSSQWNTTLGQQVYDWIKNGNYAILQYGIQNVVIFTPTNTTTGNIYSQGYYTVRDNGDELESVATTYGITVSSGTVTAVDVSPSISSAGKFFAPSNAGSTGDVVTKTADGYEWATPSGGGDAKVFTITGTTGSTNLTAATNAYTWAYTNEKPAFIYYSKYLFAYVGGTTTTAYFSNVYGNGAVSSGTWLRSRTLKLTVSSGSVIAIADNYNYINISSSAPSSSTSNNTITLVI